MPWQTHNVDDLPPRPTSQATGGMLYGGDAPVQAAALGQQPVACPSCQAPALGLGRARQQYPVPERYLKDRRTSLPKAVRRMLYTLHPCGCTVEQDWASAFTKELLARAQGTPARPVLARTDYELSYLKEGLSARAAGLSARLANLEVGSQWRLALEYEYVVVCDRLHRLDAAATQGLPALTLHPEVVSWCVKHGLFQPEPVPTDDGWGYKLPLPGIFAHKHGPPTAFKKYKPYETGKAVPFEQLYAGSWPPHAVDAKKVDLQANMVAVGDKILQHLLEQVGVPAELFKGTMSLNAAPTQQQANTLGVLAEHKQKVNAADGTFEEQLLFTVPGVTPPPAVTGMKGFDPAASGAWTKSTSLPGGWQKTVSGGQTGAGQTLPEPGEAVQTPQQLAMLAVRACLRLFTDNRGLATTIVNHYMVDGLADRVSLMEKVGRIKTGLSAFVSSGGALPLADEAREFVEAYAVVVNQAASMDGARVTGRAISAGTLASHAARTLNSHFEQHRQGLRDNFFGRLTKRTKRTVEGIDVDAP